MTALFLIIFSIKIIFVLQNYTNNSLFFFFTLLINMANYINCFDLKSSLFSGYKLICGTFFSIFLTTTAWLSFNFFVQYFFLYAHRVYKSVMFFLLWHQCLYGLRRMGRHALWSAEITGPQSIINTHTRLSFRTSEGQWPNYVNRQSARTSTNNWINMHN